MRIKTDLKKVNGVDYLEVKDVKYALDPPKTLRIKFTNTLSKDKKLSKYVSCRTEVWVHDGYI